MDQDCRTAGLLWAKLFTIGALKMALRLTLQMVVYDAGEVKIMPHPFKAVASGCTQPYSEATIWFASAISTIACVLYLLHTLRLTLMIKLVCLRATMELLVTMLMLS